MECSSWSWRKSCSFPTSLSFPPLSGWYQGVENSAPSFSGKSAFLVKSERWEGKEGSLPFHCEEMRTENDARSMCRGGIIYANRGENVVHGRNDKPWTGCISFEASRCFNGNHLPCWVGWTGQFVLLVVWWFLAYVWGPLLSQWSQFGV